MKKIISIDKDAENYKKNMDELLSKKGNRWKQI